MRVFMRRELRVNSCFRDWQYRLLCLCIYGYAYTFPSTSVCACVRACVPSHHVIVCRHDGPRHLLFFLPKNFAYISTLFFNACRIFEFYFSFSFTETFFFSFFLQECHLAKFKIYGKKSWPTWKKLVWQQQQP